MKFNKGHFDLQYYNMIVTKYKACNNSGADLFLSHNVLQCVMNVYKYMHTMTHGMTQASSTYNYIAFQRVPT